MVIGRKHMPEIRSSLQLRLKKFCLEERWMVRRKLPCGGQCYWKTTRRTDNSLWRLKTISRFDYSLQLRSLIPRKKQSHWGHLLLRAIRRKATSSLQFCIMWGQILVKTIPHEHKVRVQKKLWDVQKYFQGGVRMKRMVLFSVLLSLIKIMFYPSSELWWCRLASLHDSYKLYDANRHQYAVCISLPPLTLWQSDLSLTRRSWISWGPVLGFWVAL